MSAPASDRVFVQNHAVFEKRHQFAFEIETYDQNYLLWKKEAKWEK